MNILEIHTNYTKERSSYYCGAHSLTCCNTFEPNAIDRTPEFSWQITSGKQKFYQIQVSTSNDFQDINSILWDSGLEEGSINTNIPYKGKPLQSYTKLYWRVGTISVNDLEWSNPSTFRMGIIDPNEWGEWMGFQFASLPNAYDFFREFTLIKEIDSAILYVSARGLYEAYINGEKANDDYFGNGWTDYNKRIYYRAYDVSKLLNSNQDQNIGLRLAEGWYKGAIGYQGMHCHYGHHTMVICNLLLNYKDGSQDVLKSEKKHWLARTSPIQRSSFLHGETYDSSSYDYSWTKKGFSSEKTSSPMIFKKEATYWDQAKHHEVTLKTNLQSHPAPPVKKLKEIPSVKFWETAPGSYVYDLGQNFSGWVKVRLKGKPGTCIQIRFGERLTLDNNIFVENLRSAQCTDRITIRGNEGEFWEPSFTYHGFQYVEITGIDNPNLDDIVGIPITSSCERTGYFECSNPMINKLYSNTLWTQWSNFIDIPTDCPQRDERLGWTGDALAFVKAAAYNNNVKQFMRKWLTDLRDTQEEDGSVSNTAPRGNSFNKGDSAYSADAGWADAIVGVPWALYEMYGDSTILEENFSAICKHIDYYRLHTKEGIRSGTHTYGDWLNDQDETPDSLLQTAYFYYSLDTASKVAKTLKKISIANAFDKEKAEVKDAFQKEFMTEDGIMKCSSQTSYVLALSFGLCNEDQIETSLGQLVALIKNRGNRLSTGFIGTHLLMPCLSDHGYSDVAYDLLLQTNYPSWLYPVKLGATSIWERWNGWTPESGPGDSNMNSYSHYAFGAVTQWFYSHILGIQATKPGFTHIDIKPEILCSPLKSAKGSYETPQGIVSVDWVKDEKCVHITIDIPANTETNLVLPFEEITTIHYNDKEILLEENQHFISLQEGLNIFKFYI
jgi:alpha-L-rhamnosidase